MFSFSVSCKNVGIMIHKLKSFSCKSFAIFFHLWSGGGPNWRRDYAGVLNKRLSGTLLEKRRNLLLKTFSLPKRLLMSSKRKNRTQKLLNLLAFLSNSNQFSSIYLSPWIISIISPLIGIFPIFWEKSISRLRKITLERRFLRCPWGRHPRP